MKITINKLINEPIEAKLQLSIKVEQDSAQIYEAMSAWCNYNGFKHTAKFFHIHAGEERKHSDWVIEFLEDKNCCPKMPAIDCPTHSWMTLRDVLVAAYAHEGTVTKNWNDVANEAMKYTDHDTYGFALYLLKEQREEHVLFASLIDKYNLSEGAADIIFDRDIKHPEVK